MPRFALRAAFVAATLAGLAAAPACGQRPGRPSGQPRLFLSGFAGRYTDFGGFSDDQNAFYSFKDATAFGGSVHFRPGQGAQFGVDVVWSRPAYRRFDRDTQTELSQGDATTTAVLASARLAGGGGVLGLYLTGAAGAFFWKIDGLSGRSTDPALMIGVGLDYALLRSGALFGEYNQWWVYHPKDETVVKNTAAHTLIRVGLRFGL